MTQASVKEALLNTIEGIKNNPSMASVVFRADSKLEEDVRCSVQIRDFEPMMIDEPPELGGQDSAANPVELVLSALGTCQEIMYSAYASVMDIKLDSVTVSAKGYLDLHGLFGMDESVPAGTKKIAFETNIESPASDDELRTLIETVENHCPVLDILARAQSISGVAKVGGRELMTMQKDAA